MYFNTPLVFALAVLTAAAAAQVPARLSLREAVDAAARLNPDVAAAQLSALESQANREAIRSAYWPQLQLAAGSAYQTNNLAGIGISFPGVPSRIGPFRTFNARPVLSQTVVDLSLLASIRAARFAVEQQRYEAEAVREGIQLAVLQLYLQALQADSRLAAAQARLETAEAVLRQALDFEQTGAGSRLDVARAAQRCEEERTVVIGARRDSRTLRILLLETIGLSPAPDVELEPLTAFAETASAERNGVVVEAYAVRPELRALEAAERAARQQEKRAAAERLPKFGFQADFGLLGQGPQRSVSTYAIAGTMTIPLWTGGRIAAGRKAARARRQQIEASLRKTRLGVQRETEQALTERDAARDSLTAARAAAAAARQSLELARLRYEAGLATSLDVITAQGLLAQAEDLEIRTRYDYLLATARLARARGDVNAFFDML